MELFFENNKNRAGGIEYPFYVTFAGTETEGYEAPPHWHYHSELLFFISGSLRVFIGNQYHTVNAGDLVIIYPCQVHSVSVEPGVTAAHYIIGFDPELLSPVSNLAFELKYLLPQMASAHPQQTVIPAAAHKAYLEDLLSEMLMEYRSKQTGFELAVTAGIYKIIIWVLRELENKGQRLIPDYSALKSSMLKFKEALAYVDEHSSEPLSAVDIAKLCCMSYSHFSRLFRSIMNTTFMQYLNHVRIRKAEMLLLDSQKSITEIAVETGFSDLSYFIKQFKSSKEMSPNQYRKLLSAGRPGI